MGAAVGHGVVGHHAFDPVDAQLGQGGGSAAEEPGAGGGGFVGMDFGVSDTGVVVDGAADVVLADAGAVAGASAFEAVASVDPPAAASRLIRRRPGTSTG
ncbi:hypothetical protein Amsp01_036830 [Amycolatopsis sp. NBRC 101858]|nr:hypothetical protein Amsp01_036830 [Amycolatopsis sp. NBRC 101858]